MSLAPTSSPDPRGALPERDPRPTVAVPRDAVPLPALIALGVILTLGLFLYLNGQRLAQLKGTGDDATSKAARAPTPPPPLIVPPPPEPVIITREVPVPAPSPKPAPVAPVYVARPVPAAPPPPAFAPVSTPKPVAEGTSRPSLVVDLTSGQGAAVNGTGGAAPANANAAAGADADEAVRATIIKGRASIIPQGAIIDAVLETPLNSDRPGLARAIVSHDARGFDGTRVLIPRGSRLIGEFRASNAPGLSRVLVTWTRLIRPDGVAIRIGSPATDTLGGAGIAGSVNTHFFERFASAALQSALAIGVNVASQVPNNGNSSIYLGLPAQASQLGQQLIPNVNRPPTVKVREGAPVAILVAHDLDFAGTPPLK
ncbi:TrbI/VirB10 family protein [Sphingomonas sp. GlSt437]|uniref:TrbI/VirB10 family protein n=1 Tax=Sphingomonas sp. GlSt437 TaxID=3389970 RepID=UPI003A887B35